MAPRTKITRDEIVETAVSLIREHGESALNARAIAAELNCSTQPIFSNFKTMEELQRAAVQAIYNVYFQFLQREAESGKYPTYKAFGMAYIRFAVEEKEFFKLLFMCDRREKDISPSTDFDQSIELIQKANGVSKETAALMHLEIWTCVHGIATMHATSFLSLDWDLVSRILTDVYQGVRHRHLSKERNDECNQN